MRLYSIDMIFKFVSLCFLLVQNVRSDASCLIAPNTISNESCFAHRSSASVLYYASLIMNEFTLKSDCNRSITYYTTLNSNPCPSADTTLDCRTAKINQGDPIASNYVVIIVKYIPLSGSLSYDI